MNQILIKILGLTYSLVALPAMAIIAVAYYLKNRNKGGALFLIGAIATAAGSIFNKLFPLHFFLNETTGVLSSTGKALSEIALITHICGFFIMVIAWGIITFGKKERIF